MDACQCEKYELVITAAHKYTIVTLHRFVHTLSQCLKYHDDNTSTVCGAGENDKQEGERKIE